VVRWPAGDTVVMVVSDNHCLAPTSSGYRKFIGRMSNARWSVTGDLQARGAPRYRANDRY